MPPYLLPVARDPRTGERGVGGTLSYHCVSWTEDQGCAVYSRETIVYQRHVEPSRAAPSVGPQVQRALLERSLYDLERRLCAVHRCRSGAEQVVCRRARRLVEELRSRASLARTQRELNDLLAMAGELEGFLNERLE